MADVFIIQSYYKDSTVLVGIEGVYSRYEWAENKIEKDLIPRFGNRYDFSIVRWGVN